MLGAAPSWTAATARSHPVGLGQAPPRCPGRSDSTGHRLDGPPPGGRRTEADPASAHPKAGAGRLPKHPETGAGRRCGAVWSLQGAAADGTSWPAPPQMMRGLGLHEGDVRMPDRELDDPGSPGRSDLIPAAPVTTRVPPSMIRDRPATGRVSAESRSAGCPAP